LGEDATGIEGLRSGSGLGTGTTANELQGDISRGGPLAQGKAGPFPVCVRAWARRPILGKSLNTYSSKTSGEVFVQGLTRDGDGIGERVRTGVGRAGCFDETDCRIDAGERSKAPRRTERRLAVLRAQQAMEIGERLWRGGGTVTKPDIKGPIAAPEDGSRLNPALMGELDHLSRDPGEVLSAGIERPDLQGGSVSGLSQQGGHHPVQDLGRVDPVGQSPFRGEDPDRDSFFSEGPELERELVGELSLRAVTESDGLLIKEFDGR
jgi:hypothetical protein